MVYRESIITTIARYMPRLQRERYAKEVIVPAAIPSDQALEDSLWMKSMSLIADGVLNERYLRAEYASTADGLKRVGTLREQSIEQVSLISEELGQMVGDLERVLLR